MGIGTIKVLALVGVAVFFVVFGFLMCLGFLCRCFT